jgi:hypothetical protein
MESIDDAVTADVKFSIVPEWIIDSGCSDKALRLYVVLARYADNDKSTAYPGRGTLAKRMGCHRASVDRAVDELVKLGAITKQVRVKDGQYQSSLYTVRRLPPSRTYAATPSRTHATTPVAPVQRPPSHPCDIELELKNENQGTTLATPKKRVPDLLFEAVAEASGCAIERLTRTERGQINRATGELREIGATPDQVKAKARAWSRVYPGATLTPIALVKHWSALDGTGNRNSRSAWDEYTPMEEPF